MLKYPKIKRLGHPDTDGLFSGGESTIDSIVRLRERLGTNE